MQQFGGMQQPFSQQNTQPSQMPNNFFGL